MKSDPAAEHQGRLPEIPLPPQGKRMTMYGLRHSLLTWLPSEGVDLMTLRTIAGHKCVSTRRYHSKVKKAVSGLIGHAEGPFAARPKGTDP